MSAHGKIDGLPITGTVEVDSGNVDVVGTSTTFMTELTSGDCIFIDDFKYQVARVFDDELLELTANAETSGSGLTAIRQQGPRWIRNTEKTPNHYNIQDIVGVDVEESKVPSNRARNLRQPGWYHILEYTDSKGNKRQRNELLVAMSKDFTKENIGDADGDAVTDFFLYFDEQPQSFETDDANANVDMFVTVIANDANVTISYQWQTFDGNTEDWVNLTDTNPFSGTTTNVLSISNVTGLGNTEYRLVAEGIESSGANVDGAVSDVVSIKIN